MKNKMKRTISMVLVLSLCIGLLPLLPIEVEAASNIIINGVDIGYANGSYFTKNGKTCKDNNNYHSDGTTAKATCHNRDGYDCTNTTDPSCNCMRYWPTGQASTCQIDLRASQCFGFARYCQWKVYGTYDLNTPSAFTDLTGKVSSGNCTGSYLKQRLINCAPATHLRTQESVKGYGHSICIIDTTDYGINFTDCNHYGDCGVRYATMSWDELANFVKGYGGIEYAKSYKQSVAFTAPYAVSSSYEASTYYAALCNVKLTGNQREDIVNIALSQVGYKEGSSLNDYSGADDGSYNNYTEYNYWYNKYVSSGMPVGGSSAPWCATFVSWCAEMANVPASVLKRSTGAGHGAGYFNINFYSGSSTLASNADNDSYFKGYNYVPQKGDLFYTRSWSHVGLVVAVDGSKVITVEGNTNNTGSTQGNGVYKLTTRNIADLYFGVPNYSTGNSGGNTSSTVLSSYNMVLPLKAYLMGTSTVYPYTTSQMTMTNGGEIWSSDECTITEVYSNGACKVTYPVGNTTRTAFAALTNFLVNTSGNFTKQTIDRKITTYIRPGGAEYGYIDSGDEIYTIGTSGSMTQIFYPVDAQYGGGYKLAWVETNQLNTAHTCNKNEFVFFEEAHPHYNCYRCTVCGEIFRDTTTAYSANCRDCNIPGKPVLKDVKTSYLDSETVKFMWDATEHTTQYNIWIDKKNVQGEWEKYEQISSVTSGKTVKLGLGEYRAYVQSYNSDFRLADGSDYLHTDGDSVYFSVVKSQYTVVYNVNGGTGGVASQTKTYGKPLTLSTAVPAKENDIFIGWGTEDNPTVVQYQPGDTYAADSDVVLVAVWKQDLHPTIAVDTISGKPGETVTVPVYMTENPGIIAARLKISYDPNLLKLIFVSDGNILGAHQFGEDLTVNPYIVSWSNGDAAEDYVANGALVYLIFEIAEDAPAGEFAITVSYDPAEIYNKDLTNVTFDVQQGVVEVTHEDMPEAPNEEPKGGCYIATCVYGSYDCSEVWTLRRFRDNTLASTWAGRAFIRTYYAVSPTLVEWFGEADWFRTMWKGMLDVLVDVLNGLGVADTAYEDKAW